MNPITAEQQSFKEAAKKFRQDTELEIYADPLVEHRIINFPAVFHEISNLVKCKKCGNEVSFLAGEAKGLGFKIEVSCKKCTPTLINSSNYEKGAFMR